MYPSNVVKPAAYFFYFPGTSKLTGYPNGSTSTPFDGAFKADYESDGRHFDGVNMAFADGHVKWLKVAKVFAEAQACPSAKESSATHLPCAWDPFSDNSSR